MGKNWSFGTLNGRPLHDQVQVWAEQLSSPPAELTPRLCLAKHMILRLLSVAYTATGSLTDPCSQQETCHKSTSFLDEENFGCLSLPVGSVATAFIYFSSDRASPNKKCALQCKNCFVVFWVLLYSDHTAGYWKICWWLLCQILLLTTFLAVSWPCRLLQNPSGCWHQWVHAAD